MQTCAAACWAGETRVTTPSQSAYEKSSVRGRTFPVNAAVMRRRCSPLSACAWSLMVNESGSGSVESPVCVTVLPKAVRRKRTPSRREKTSIAVEDGMGRERASSTLIGTCAFSSVSQCRMSRSSNSCSCFPNRIQEGKKVKPLPSSRGSPVRTLRMNSGMERTTYMRFVPMRSPI